MLAHVSIRPTHLKVNRRLTSTVKLLITLKINERILMLYYTATTFEYFVNNKNYYLPFSTFWANRLKPFEIKIHSNLRINLIMISLLTVAEYRADWQSFWYCIILASKIIWCVFLNSDIWVNRIYTCWILK